MDQQFLHEFPPPWERESPMTRELLVDAAPNGKSRFHLIDPWHTFHLGVGKTWVACGIMMIQALIAGGHIDQRIAALASGYKEFCKRKKLPAVLSKIDIRTFNGTADPIGTWNKAAVTANWMQFLEEWCEQHSEQVQRDERLRVFVLLLN